MYKNQLQELAQRSCFNLPSYSCVREGPDHAPRFKVTVSFNGETFESPTFCPTLRQAEHAAAEVALNTLANRGPSKALASRVLDENGVYKNLLQETAHRAGSNLPIYSTVRSGPGHIPTFRCMVELAGLSFSGEPAKTKKQAQKNAAMAAWSTLKQLARHDSSSSSSSPSPCFPSETEGGEEQEQVLIARFLANIQPTKSKSSPQQPQDGQIKSIHNFRDPLRASSSTSYPLQYGTWAYSGYPTEMPMYRVLPVSPPPMPPFLPPDHIYYTIRPGPPVSASRPFYFSPPPIPPPIRGRSMVKIQELHDERKDGSHSEALTAPIVSDNKTTKEVFRETVEENDKQMSMSEAKLGESGQQERGQKGNFRWVPAKNIKSVFSPLEIHSCESSQSNHRSNSQKTSEPPLYMVSPVRIRNVGPTSSSVGVRPQNLVNRMPAPGLMKTGGSTSSYKPRTGFVLPSRFMAPAVQIRSVVPVCSAPPPKRKVPTSVQEGNSSRQEGKKEQEDTPAVTSELDKLHI